MFNKGETNMNMLVTYIPRDSKAEATIVDLVQRFGSENNDINIDANGAAHYIFQISSQFHLEGVAAALNEMGREFDVVDY